VWKSGTATTATITLVDTNTSGPYNDFAIDDLAFRAVVKKDGASGLPGGRAGPQGPVVPEPASWALMIIGLGGVGAVLRLGRRKDGVASAAI